MIKTKFRKLIAREANTGWGVVYSENSSTLRTFFFYILSILSTPRREYAES
jgi:hypothetical protein